MESYSKVSVFPLNPRNPASKTQAMKIQRKINIETFSSVQSFSCVRLSANPWIAARLASLSITISQSSLKLTCIESVMPSSHLILCRPLLLLPPIPPSIRVFSNESTLRMRWPKYWSFSFSIIPSKEIPELISRYLYSYPKYLGICTVTRIQRLWFFYMILIF